MDLLIKENLFHVPESVDEKPYLIGCKCRRCGYTCFPTKQVCVKCLKDDCMEKAKFGPNAVLESFAVINVAPPGFTAPYIQGYVKLQDGPKVFSLISGCEPKDDAIELGQRMELVIEKIREDENGNNLIGWKFKPTRERNQS
jgi:uncharacterized OB-fold protein